MTSGHFESLKNTNIQLHQACQFLAIIGKNLIPQEADDSNTTMGIIATGLIGRKVEGSTPFHAFIDIPGFTLNLVDPGMSRIWATQLDGKSRDEILQELQQVINDLGMDGRQIQHISHYTLEYQHPIQSGATFEKPNDNLLEEWHAIYSTARVDIREALSDLLATSELRIWPHHFDMGSFIPLTEDGSAAIGVGLAPPDAVFDGFYYYIFGWQKDKSHDHKKLEPLNHGQCPGIVYVLICF